MLGYPLCIPSFPGIHFRSRSNETTKHRTYFLHIYTLATDNNKPGKTSTVNLGNANEGLSYADAALVTFKDVGSKMLFWRMAITL